jgi:hypothetical protein
VINKIQKKHRKKHNNKSINMNKNKNITCNWRSMSCKEKGEKNKEVDD